jgi:hypothetical protein
MVFFYPIESRVKSPVIRIENLNRGSALPARRGGRLACMPVRLGPIAPRVRELFSYFKSLATSANWARAARHGEQALEAFNDLKLVHCPRSLAPTLVTLPSMSLIPFAPFGGDDVGV